MCYQQKNASLLVGFNRGLGPQNIFSSYHTRVTYWAILNASGAFFVFQGVFAYLVTLIVIQVDWNVLVSLWSALSVISAIQKLLITSWSFIYMILLNQVFSYCTISYIQSYWYIRLKSSCYIPTASLLVEFLKIYS